MSGEPQPDLITIDELTLGPYGVGHLGGKAVMVANCAPGDTVEVSIGKTRRDYSVARLRKVIQAGPHRRIPPCPFLPRCGGCDWQQIDYRGQLAAKARLIAAELNRALGLRLDAADLVVPAPAEFGYRSRLRLKVRDNGALGFFELGSNRLVEVDRCLLAGEDLDFDPARTLAAALTNRCDEIEIVKAGPRQVLVAHLRGLAQPPDVEHARKLIASKNSLAGIVLRGGAQRVAIGEPTIKIDLEPGLQLLAEADAFSQVNQEQNPLLVASVMEQGAIQSAVSVLDLFCGAGNFSLPAARRGARVLGVDADPVAVTAAERNATRLGLADARFAAMRAEQIAPFLSRAGYRPQTVILDPPRTGARELMEPIIRLMPGRIVYVSCDLPTLARDLRILVKNDYAITSVKVFDFFPNTHHAEMLVLLT